MLDFDELVARGESLLWDAIEAQMQEGLTLDFKAPAIGKQGAAFNDRGQLTKEGRTALAKSLSAFSNSAGGVLVIGVDCRRNDEGVDCATSLEPIPSWKIAVSAVSAAVGDLLQPKNDGIRVAGFASREDKKAGYVVVSIPRSERRPHRSEAADQKQYFKRSGSSSYAMEHVDIEDAFKRASVPELEVKPRWRRISWSGANAQFHLEFWLDNVGEATAFFPSLELQMRATCYPTWPNNVLGVHRERMPAGQMSYGNSEFVIHPGQTRLIEKVEIHFVFDDAKQVPEFIGGLAVNNSSLRFRYAVFAKDMRKRVGEIMFGPEEFSQVRWDSA
ncbi:AlbA family DNA-binding domain-containing protein [Mesorhizobium sp. ArgA1]